MSLESAGVSGTKDISNVYVYMPIQEKQKFVEAWLLGKRKSDCSTKEDSFRRYCSYLFILFLWLNQFSVRQNVNNVHLQTSLCLITQTFCFKVISLISLIANSVVSVTWKWKTCGREVLNCWLKKQ